MRAALRIARVVRQRVTTTQANATKPYTTYTELVDGLSGVPDGPLYGTLAVGFDGQISASQTLKVLGTDGATTVKIEHPKTGDPKRKNSPPTAFNNYNVGKHSITFSPDNRKDQKLKAELLHAAHVVVDNRSKGARERDVALQATLLDPHRPHPLIYCIISGFGPNNDRRFYDRLGQAGSGMAAINGKDGVPKLVPAPIIDIASGNEAARAIANALYFLERHKPKLSVVQLEVNMMKVAFNLLSNTTATFIDTNKAKSTIVPFGLYKTKDGYIAVAIAKDEQFTTLCDTLGIKELAEKYPNNDARLSNKKIIKKALKEVLKNETNDYWFTLLTSVNIAVEPVRSLPEAIEIYGKDIIQHDLSGNKYTAPPTTSSAFTERPSIKTAPSHGSDRSFVRQLLASLPSHNVSSGLESLLGEAREANRANGHKTGGFYTPPIEQKILRKIFEQTAEGFEWVEGKIFFVKKTMPVQAEQIKKNETIDLVVHGISNSKQTGSEGDWKITTKTGEKHFLTDSKFKEYYDINSKEDNRYNPKDKPRKAIYTSKDVRIQTPENWGGTTIYARKGSILIYTNEGNVYPVHPRSFMINFEKCDENGKTIVHDRRNIPALTIGI